MPTDVNRAGRRWRSGRIRQDSATPTPLKALALRRFKIPPRRCPQTRIQIGPSCCSIQPPRPLTQPTPAVAGGVALECHSASTAPFRARDHRMVTPSPRWFPWTGPRRPRLPNNLVSHGSDGLVVAGNQLFLVNRPPSAGRSSNQLLATGSAPSADRAHVIAGTAANCTPAKRGGEIRQAQAHGADGPLLVVPITTSLPRTASKLHSGVANRGASLSVMLYQHPGRTGLQAWRRKPPAASGPAQTCSFSRRPAAAPMR